VAAVRARSNQASSRALSATWICAAVASGSAPKRERSSFSRLFSCPAFGTARSRLDLSDQIQPAPELLQQHLRLARVLQAEQTEALAARERRLSSL
jgi:hypothetical protein